MKIWWMVLCASIALSACAKEDPVDVGENNTSTNNDNNQTTPNNGTSNTVNNTVVDGPMMLPITLQQTVDENCMSCHSTGGIGPYDFSDVNTFVALGDLIVRSVEERVMPPWNVDPTCADLKGELRLSDEEIAHFTEWLDDGKPLIPVQEYDKPEPKSPEIGDPPAETDEVFDFMIPTAYEPVFGRSEAYEEDDFRCFVVDPGFTEDRELTGFEVLVDNVELSHHMVVFTADGDAENRAALEALENQDEAPGFSCFGVSGFNVNNIAAVWAPGGGRVSFPQRQGIGQTAVPIEAESLVVIQMHYNKAAQDAGVDQSGVRMWFRPEGEPVHELAQANWTFIGNLPFRVPAGVDGTMVPDDSCDTVYTLVGGDEDDPISPPAGGFIDDEVECGIETEDCEAQFGAGAPECAIDYGSRLQLQNVDLTATYSVTVAGEAISYDAAAAGAAGVGDIAAGLAGAINTNANLDGMVEATLRDRDNDGADDEIVIQNLDDATEVRTESFAATGTAEVRQRYIDSCAQWDPARLVEARGVGASGCVQMDVYYRNPAPLKMWAAFSHMHLLGQRISTEILPTDDDGSVTTAREGDGFCAARTDAWDFDWQRTYWYQEPKNVPVNGVVRLRCRYDNSDSTEEVRLGDGSGSEMCLALVYLTL